MKNGNKKTEKQAILVITLALAFTRGLYKFFCKTTAAVMEKVLFIFGKTEINEHDENMLARLVWIVNHMALKLEGICSISSSVHDNAFCAARRKIKDCICKYCYAHNQQARHTGLKEHNIINGIILRNILLPVKAFKSLVIVFPYLRIESFGDVMNVTQARNYIRIIKAFPEKRCAIWSKNIKIWAEAFRLEGKPKNTTYVHSSSKVNEPDKIDLNKYDFIDHIFTVYDKKYIKEHNIIINCGGKKCMDCIKARKNCYYRTSKNNNMLYINEEKK